MRILKILIHKLLPSWLKRLFRLVLSPKALKSKRKFILDKYKKVNLEQQPIEVREAINYLRKHPFSSFPFFWALEFDKFFPEIFTDTRNGFYYVIFNGKKLYFPKNCSKTQLTWAYRGILREQHAKSAHLYLTEKFYVDQDSVLIDAGVAEGSFSLNNINKLKKLYLIECNPIWVEALKLTFEPWSNKVEIVEKYLSDNSEGENIKIDDLIRSDKSNRYFVKMDVEGYELRALDGMANFMSDANYLKISICTYHRPDDADRISAYLNELEFDYHFSEGYVLFSFNNEPPSFRKTILRAEKRIS